MRRAADLLACGVGYAIGSLPFGLWLGRLSRGVDVRDHGSGSTGATNVLRTLGPGAGAVTFAFDVAKGAASVGVARCTGADPAGQAAAGVAATVGHCWPAFGGFRGGKGVATALGALLVVSPPSAVAAVVGGGAALAATRVVSIGSLAGTACAVVGSAVDAQRRGSLVPAGFAVATATLIAVRHQQNLRRIFAGTEPRMTVPWGRDVNERSDIS